MALGGGGGEAATGRVAGGFAAGTSPLPDSDREVVKSIIDLAVNVDPGVPLHYWTKSVKLAKKIKEEENDSCWKSVYLVLGVGEIDLRFQPWALITKPAMTTINGEIIAKEV